MTKRIYFHGEADEPCEALGEGGLLPSEPDDECPNDGTFHIEDRDTGEGWFVCGEHKEQIKAEGIAF